MSDARIDYTAFAQLLCEKHKENGCAALCMDRDFTDAFYALHCEVPGVKFTMENLTKDEEVIQFPGKQLYPKKVKRALWEHRKDERLQDFTSVVYTMYDKDTGKSVMGFAKLHQVPQPTPVKEMAHA